MHRYIFQQNKDNEFFLEQITSPLMRCSDSKGWFNIETDRHLTEDELSTLIEILHYLPYAGKRDLSEHFLSLPFDDYPPDLLSLAVNAYDLCGNTILGVACEAGDSVACVQKLIDLGARINTKDFKGEKTALYWAVFNKLSFFDGNSKEAAAVVQCLLDNGADCSITDYRGITPLQYAESNRFTVAAQMIREHLNPEKESKVVIKCNFGFFSDNSDEELASSVFGLGSHTATRRG